MVRILSHAVACWAAVCFFGLGCPAVASADEPVVSRNLHRVRVLLEGDARALWLGDSWGRWSRVDRLPHGALATWPFPDVTALEFGVKGGGGIARALDYTSGDGALESVNPSNGWVVEETAGGPAYFALPVGDVSKVYGDTGLVLPTSGPNEDRVQALGVNNVRFAEMDGGVFSEPGESFRGRVLYYAPSDLADMVERVNLSDWGEIGRGAAALRVGARPKWHLGQDADGGSPVPATPSQINAVADDIVLERQMGVGPRVVISQEGSTPLVGSGDYWFMGGVVVYRVDADGERVPGYYHSVLAQDSWSFAGHAENVASTGDKTFSDEQLLHWLDVTTLDRAQTPVVVLHIATEYRVLDTLEPSVRRILTRYRDLFSRIGSPEPLFLLVGSYMHRINGRDLGESREMIEQLDLLYLRLAETEPDCAFFSLYEATDRVFFATDALGGAGTQQTARDWLDANGWSTITYGGATYNLSTADNDGLDGVMTADGLHLSAAPAAAFYAKLLGDAILASRCPGDFDGDDDADTQDVLAFLNAWAASDPAADVNGDGSVDTRDVLAFLGGWAEGC